MDQLISLAMCCIINLTIIYITNKMHDNPPSFKLTVKHEYDQEAVELEQREPDIDPKTATKDMVEALNEFIMGGDSNGQE